MEISIAGVLVCSAILLMSRFSAHPSIFALISSLAFGSTAIVILSALGGASPIMYVVFLCALLAGVALRRNAIQDLSALFARQPTAWVVLFLILYVTAGAILLPRLFAGATTVFVPVRDEGRVAEIPLVPVTGNITQALYFVLDGLSFFAFSILLLKPRAFIAIKQGFFAWATLHVAMGFIDLFGKISGAGDVLAPIRTASYTMLTDVTVGGFWRIAGAYSEASSFGAISVALLAFTFTYWKYSRDAFALALTLALLVLLSLSTSSTAYVAGGVLLIVLMISVVGSILQNRLQVQDLILLIAGFAGVAALTGLVLYNEHALDRFMDLLDTMVLNKASSASAQERAYWNLQSLQSVYDTVGLGIGLGSSRASSWVIAVISQLGVIGALLIGVLVCQILRGGCLRHARELDPQTRTTVLSVRAASLAALLTSSVSGGGADPGLVFFLTLSAVTSLRATARAEGRAPSLTEGGRWYAELQLIPRRA
jgi:hypothetical protein